MKHNKRSVSAIFIVFALSVNGQTKSENTTCKCKDTMSIKTNYDYNDIENSENFLKMIEYPKKINSKKSKNYCLKTVGIDSLHSISIQSEEKRNQDDSDWVYNNPIETILIVSSEMEFNPIIDLCTIQKGNYILYIRVGEFYFERIKLRIR